MANPMLDSEKKMIDTADLLRQSADDMAIRRMKALKAGEIDVVEFRNNVVRENFLRNQVSEILLKAIDSVIGGIQGEQADLEKAIKKASETIKKIQAIKKALDVFAALVGLAESIALGKPQGILDAFMIVKDTTQA
jgi:hypothetical protein